MKLKASWMLMCIITTVICCSCSKTITVKPETSQLKGDLKEYFEIVEREYTSVDEGEHYKSLILELKRTDKVYPFKSIDDVNVNIKVELLDNNKNIVATIDGDSKYESISNIKGIKDLLKVHTGETGTIRVKVDVDVEATKFRIGSSMEEKEKETVQISPQKVEVKERKKIDNRKDFGAFKMIAPKGLTKNANSTTDMTIYNTKDEKVTLMYMSQAIGNYTREQCDGIIESNFKDKSTGILNLFGGGSLPLKPVNVVKRKNSTIAYAGTYQPVFSCCTALDYKTMQEYTIIIIEKDVDHSSKFASLLFKGEEEPTENIETELNLDSAIDTSDNPTFSTIGSAEADELIKTYDEYVTKYISYMKKAAKGDMSALAEYPSLMKKAQELGKKLEKSKGKMSISQYEKYNRITMRMLKAAEEIE